MRRFVRGASRTLGGLVLLAGWITFAAYVNGALDQGGSSEASAHFASVASETNKTTPGRGSATRLVPAKPGNLGLATTALPARPATYNETIAEEIDERNGAYSQDPDDVATAAQPARESSPPAVFVPYTASRSKAGGKPVPRPGAAPGGASGATRSPTLAGIGKPAGNGTPAERRALAPTPLTPNVRTPSFLPASLAVGPSAPARAPSPGSAPSRSPGPSASSAPNPGPAPSRGSAPSRDPGPSALADSGQNPFPPTTRNSPGDGPLLVADWVLDGTDPVESSVRVVDGGAINPGHSPGALPISGDLVIDGGLLLIEIAGSDAGQYDQLLVSGTVTLVDAVIEFSFLDGFEPAIGDILDFLHADGGIEALDIASIEMTGLPAYLGFALVPDYDLHRELLVAVSLLIVEAPLRLAASTEAIADVPTPATLLLVITGLVALGAARRRSST